MISLAMDVGPTIFQVILVVLISLSLAGRVVLLWDCITECKRDFLQVGANHSIFSIQQSLVTSSGARLVSFAR